MPRVSVVIPSYNSARYVSAAIDSVLAQTSGEPEVLVVDDGSKDDTREVVSRYGDPVRYLYQQNAGVSEARNHGIRESRGEYVAFLDADDTWMPHKLERQLAALKAAPGTALCYAAHVVVDERLNPLGVQRGERWGSALEDLLFHGNVVGSICTVVVERRLLEKSGGFDSRLSQCADWEMWVKLARHTEFLYLDEPLVTYRQHGANMSRNTPLLEKDSLLLLSEAFAHPDTPAAFRARQCRAMGRNWMVLAGCYFHAGRYADFLRCASRALASDGSQVTRLLGYPVRKLRRALPANQP